MEKVDITFQDFVNSAHTLREETPWLLVSTDGHGRPNVMTVGATGFGTVGELTVIFVNGQGPPVTPPS